MISFNNGAWSNPGEIEDGTVVFEETPILVCPSEIPAVWRKISKKISKLEPDRKPDNVLDTMPSWEQVSLNEAIPRLVFAFDALDRDRKERILEMRTLSAAHHDSPFASLIKKAKQILTKDGAKAGLSKSTISVIEPLLYILTTKVCVTLDGGAVLFRSLGTIPHSCTPNCMFIPRSGNVGQLVAIRDISIALELTWRLVRLGFVESLAQDVKVYVVIPDMITDGALSARNVIRPRLELTYRTVISLRYASLLKVM
jgi:hypothetical protein